MSYQVLARKWRPRTFDQVVGQQHVLQALVNALDNNRLHHAYLFSGTRGVGKTSIARLLAKALNCEESVSAQPCGKCQSCLEIDAGNFVDLIEIDAASKTKVEDTRDILDNVQYKPTRGRYKVYLIDEVHMLSRSSFNALLKTLEEPPEHVKFLFATTEAHKLPVTILSRCLQFNLKAISAQQIAQQLEHILQQEQVGFEEKALSLIANAAEGSMRDALSLTDQGISFGNGNLATADVAAMLGTLDSDYSSELLMLAAQANGDQLLSKANDLSQFAPDYDQLLKQMSKDVHLASLCQVVKSAARLGNEPKSIVELAGAVEAEMLQLFYHILLQGRKELAFAPDPRSGFEMVLLRLLAFMPKVAAQTETEPQADVELDMLASQQQAILQQAKQLTSSHSSSSLQSSVNANEKPAEEVKQAAVAPAISKPLFVEAPLAEPVQVERTEQSLPVASQALANQPLVAQPLENQPLVSQGSEVVPPPAEFSEQDLLNMSYAMAADDQSPLEQSQFGAPEPKQDQPLTQAPADSSGINDFLAARKVLRNKVTKEAEVSVKKPPAVKTATASRRIEPSTLVQAPLPQVKTNNEASVAQLNEQPKNAGMSSAVSFEPITPAVVTSNENRVDPATLLAPNTDDPWSVLIDEMALSGRLRLLAVQSSYQKQDNQVTLLLRTEHRHLLAPSASEQLEQHLRQYLSAEINLTIEIGSDEQLTPDQLALNLHQQRLTLAGQCIGSDVFIGQFEQLFGAQVNLDSINYRRLKN